MSLQTKRVWSGYPAWQKQLLSQVYSAPYVLNGQSFFFRQIERSYDNFDIAFVSSDGLDVVTFGPVFNVLLALYEDRYLQYCNRVGMIEMAIKYFRWRNGYNYDFTNLGFKEIFYLINTDDNFLPCKPDNF